MCHYCGAKLAKSSDYTEQENGHSPELSSGRLIKSCKLCGKKIYKESANRENSRFCAMPSISATVSLKSVESTTSNCSTVPLYFLPHPILSSVVFLLFLHSYLPIFR